jgi:hypothetical protein
MYLDMAIDEDLGWMDEYGKDLVYFRANRDDLCNKHKNQFVAVKNLKVYHAINPLELQEQLKKNCVDVAHTFVEFMGDVSKFIR